MSRDNEIDNLAISARKVFTASFPSRIIQMEDSASDMNYMKSKANRIRFHISGDILIDGKVPVRIFSRMINQIQETVSLIGNLEIGADPTTRRKSQTPKFELLLVEIKPGSLTCELELPDTQQDLFPDRKKINQSVLEKCEKVVSSCFQRDYEALQREVADPSYRQRIFAAINAIAPSKDEEFKIEINIGESNLHYPLEKIDKRKNPEFYQSIQLLAQELDENMESLINAKCIAVVPSEGPLKIKEVIDYKVDASSAEAQTLQNFTEDNLIFTLKTPLKIQIKKSDDLFTIDHEQLDIHVFGSTKDEAITSFKQDFSYIWSEYALADDNDLLDHALSLKKHILNLVKKAELVER